MRGNVGQFLTYDEETRCDSESDIHTDLEIVWTEYGSTEN